MKRIKNLVDRIEDEVCSAKDYAECYVDLKSKGNTQWANRYKEMANDELKHATYLHDITVQEIEELKKLYTPPEKMKEKWEKCHIKYVEKVAWIKQMLTL